MRTAGGIACWLALAAGIVPGPSWAANDSIANATSLALGSAAAQTLTSSQTVAYFKAAVPAGKFSVNVKHSNTGNSVAGWNLAVYDAAQSTQYLGFTSIGTETDKTLSVYLPAGTYYVKVSDNRSGSLNTEFSLTGTSTTAAAYETEANDSIATAIPMVLGTAYSGIVQSRAYGDVDYFKVTVPAGKLSVNFKHANTGNSVAGWNLAVYDSGESTQYLGFTSMGTETDKTLSVDVPAGTYYVKVTDSRSGSLDTEYQLTATSTATAAAYETEANDSLATATPLVIGTAYSGIVQSRANGDADYFKVTVPAGKFSVNFKHADTGNSVAGWNLAVYDSAESTQYLGFTSVGTETDKTLSVYLPAGTYYVKITDSRSGSLDTDYQLTVTSTATAAAYETEANDSAAAATPLVLGTAHSGIIQSRANGDVDYFRMTVPAGKVALNFKHANTGNSVAGWNVAVYDATESAQYLGFTSTGTETDKTLSVDLPAGTYYVKIADSRGGSIDVEYQLTATSTAGSSYEVENNDTTATATPIAVGTYYAGSLQSKNVTDVDYYKFSVPSSNYYVLSFKHATTGSSSTTWNAKVLDAAGKSYANLDVPGNAPDLTVGTSLLSAGTDYYVKVTDVYGRSTDLEYQLAIVPDTVPPTTALSPAAGTYTSNQNVVLSCGDPGQSGCDKIYYTTDGSAPTSASPVYTAPIAITANTTVRFFAKDLAGNSEAARTAVYVIDGAAPTTTASVPAGAYRTSQSVSLSCSDANTGCANVYYSTDGSYPTTSSSVYSGPVSIGATATLRFFAKDVAGNSESVKSLTYTIDAIAPKSAAPAGGNMMSDSVAWTKLVADGPVDLQKGVIAVQDLILVAGGKYDPYQSSVISGNIRSISTGTAWAENFDDFVLHCYTSAAMGWACNYALNAIALSGNTFVAVGNNGSIQSPSNSLVIGSSGTSQNLMGIAWSSALAKFVVVGTGGVILTSPDGASWTRSQQSATTQPLYGVAAGPVLVAVGAGGTVLRSADGAAWSAVASGTQNSLRGVVWSAALSRFVAVGDGGVVLTSADGSAWLTQNSRIFDNLLGVAASAAQVLAVGANGTILASSDGTTWNAQQSGTSATLRSVAWSGTKFVAVGDGGTVLTGVQVTPQPVTTRSIPIYCSDAGGAGCDKIYYSTDGTTPTSASAIYSGPVAISGTTTLKYFATDLAGNAEAVNAETYVAGSTSTGGNTTSTSTTTSTTTSTSTTSSTTTTVAGTTTTTQAAGSIALAAGWNLVGNGVEAPITVSQAFGDATTVVSVWKWVASGSSPGWAFYTPAPGGQTYAASKGYAWLTTIDAGEGFWVNAKAVFTVPLAAGTQVASSSFAPAGGAHALGHGWNLIAIGDRQTPAQFGAALGASLTSLWAWDAGQVKWYFWAPALAANNGLASYLTSKGYLDFATLPAQPVGTLSPTTGFWVNMP